VQDPREKARRGSVGGPVMWKRLTLLVEAVQASAGTQRCSLWMAVDALPLNFKHSFYDA
jgi:hypothetical protein